MYSAKYIKQKLSPEMCIIFIVLSRVHAIFQSNPKLIFALQLIPVILMLLFITQKKLISFEKFSKDIDAYRDAIESFAAGINPYIKTIQTFENKDKPSDHGYAYFPGLLYMYGLIYVPCVYFNCPYQVYWKIPVLIADITVGFVLYFMLLKKGYIPALFGSTMWILNSYVIARTGYTYTEPLPILFMLLSLIYLEKDDVFASTFYVLSIMFKTFPIILAPLFLLKAKNKKDMFLGGLIIAVAFCLPFMKSLTDFTTFLQGAIFVQGDRIIQGRPYLFYISYYNDIEFFQILPFKFYSLTAVILGPVLIALCYFLGQRFLKKNISSQSAIAKLLLDKYVLSTISFIAFYLFTPVLNRTYLIWFLPVFILGTFKVSEITNKKWLFYTLNILYWLFAYWYLMQWNDGFDIWRP